MSPEELAQHLQSVGVECSAAEARRALAHVVSDGRSDFTTMKKPVRATVRAAIRAHTRDEQLEIVERVVDDADGFVKYLLRSPDGALHEAVRIPLHKEGRFTICLSSQVGCAMQCAFCATGRLGFTRNLEAWEIVRAFMAVRSELPQGTRISGAVFMGQGEPLANYDEVIRAARVLSHPCGGRIEGKAISISTVGLVPQIHRFASEGHKFRLVVSLTSAIAHKRRSLLPVAGAYTLDDVADAIRAYHRASKDRVTIAWVLLGGVNTGADEVTALKELLPDVPLRINLIDVNDAREGGFARATPAELSRFLDALQLLGQPVVRRYSGGRNETDMRRVECWLPSRRQSYTRRRRERFPRRQRAQTQAGANGRRDDPRASRPARRGVAGKHAGR
jgi:23S rRNA (adenine2503-C2)-methyltransferase